MHKICHRNTVKVQVAKPKELLAALKSDCGLFSRLHISSHTRDRNLDEFLSHENHAALPTISVKWRQSETWDEGTYSALSKIKPAWKQKYTGIWCYFSCCSNGETWKIKELSRVCRHGVFTIDVEIACSIRVCLFIQTSHVTNIRQVRQVTFAVFYTHLYQVTIPCNLIEMCDLNPCIANNMKHNMNSCAQRECVQFNNCFKTLSLEIPQIR